MHPWRHHLLQALQHLRPRERFAFDQLIQELRLVAGRVIFRTIQELLRLRANLVAFRYEGAFLRHRAAVPARIDESSYHHRQ